MRNVNDEINALLDGIEPQKGDMNGNVIKTEDIFCPCGKKFHIIFRTMKEFKAALKKSDKMHETMKDGEEATIDMTIT
jgi:hypothetical protein